MKNIKIKSLISLGLQIQAKITGAAKIVTYKALCFDVAQGRMKGAPNETRTHSCRFASLAC